MEGIGHTKFGLENLIGRDHLETQRAKEKERILKWIYQAKDNVQW
jgi:hypothetical protein